MKKFIKSKEEYASRLMFAKTELSKFRDEDFGVTKNWRSEYSMPSGVYDKPKSNIINPHPRVFLNADILPKIREAFASEEYSNLTSKLMEYADSKGFTGAFEEKVHPSGETYRYDEPVLEIGRAHV